MNLFNGHGAIKTLEKVESSIECEHMHKIWMKLYTRTEADKYEEHAWNIIHL